MSKNIFNLLKVFGLIGFIFAAGCKKDDNSNKLKIGMEYEGGIIAHVNGEHGLIAAPSDADGVYIWGAAFTVCENLVIDGYDDWYLPSKEELNLLYTNKDAIGGFIDDAYWSSTENAQNGNTAWAQRFYSGEQGAAWKTATYKVRAVRSF
jgi:hypothetical protein